MILEVWELAKELIGSGKRLTLTLAEQTRSLEQNSLLHDLFTDAANQAEWMGKKRTAEEWKNLFISGHAMATKQGVEIVPGLEGEFLNIRESSAQMSVERMTSLIEYVIAWGTQNGVKFRKVQP